MCSNRDPKACRSVWTRVDGNRIHARVAGRQGDPDLVLVHGLGVSGRYFLPLLERLSTSARVWVPDLPGFGLSSRPRAALDLDGLAGALARWMRTVSVHRAVLLGNSVGCQVIVRLAAAADVATAIVLTSPTIDASARSVPRLLGRWLRAGLHEPWRLLPVVVEAYTRAGLRTTWRLFASALADRPEDALARIAVPVIVVRGARDPLVGPGWAARLARSAPRGRLVEVPRGGHALPFDSPAAVAAATRPLLAVAGGSP